LRLKDRAKLGDRAAEAFEKDGSVKQSVPVRRKRKPAMAAAAQ
jgi:hypothetical protein